jgi:ferredoxin-NADP reductase
MPDSDDDGLLDLEVVQLRRESESVLSVTLADLERALLPTWTPGAHLDVTLPGCIRQYSLCGDPADRRSYRVAVLREPQSRGGSAFVHDELRPGDLLEVGGPRNLFEFVDAPSYLFVAGGIGITPIVAMARAADAAGKDWRLVYGGRSRRSMAFVEELTAAYGDRVQLFPEDEFGQLDLPTMLRRVVDEQLVYACGPEALLSAVETQSAHWPASSLHVERFMARPADQNLVNRGFVAECHRSGIEVEVAATDSVLEALDHAGIAVANACRDGVCGSCETPVLAGEIDHRDSILTAAQRAQGDRMLICVSRAAGLRLVLDV